VCGTRRSILWRTCCGRSFLWLQFVGAILRLFQRQLQQLR
jgi:hypothetical protein